MLKTVRNLLTCLFVGAISLSANASPNNQASVSDDDYAPGGNFLDCTNFTWMQDCKNVNKWVGEHPDKPLRINKNGLHWFFPPGTPPEMIDWVVNQTPGALERLFVYMERNRAYTEKSAAMYRTALEKRGGLKGFPTLDEVANPPSMLERAETKIDTSKVALYIFTNSQCGACRSLEPNIGALRRQFPRLKISMLQINNDPAGARRISAVTGASVTILSPSKLRQYARYVQRTPTIWVQNTATNHTTTLIGEQSLSAIVRALKKESQ